MALMKTIHIPIGSIFYDLTVVDKATPLTRSNGSPRTAYLCRCTCGATTVVSTDKLKSGNTKSCGCRKNSGKSNFKHGGCRTRIYGLWCGIKSRCQYPKNSRFSSYGGRGISLCPEWQKFLPFKQWAYANGYNDTLTIERKNVNGNYCPENCCWIPSSEQWKNMQRHLV